MITSAAIAPIFSNMRPLCTLLPARAPKQLMPVNVSSAAAAITLSFQATPVSAAKVRGENHRDCGHAASLRNQKQSPSIHERDRRMVRVAQVDVLTAGRAGQTRRKFSPDECAAHREQPAKHPDAENQKRRVHAVRDLGRIRKNSRADDAAHHEHRRVKQPKLTARFRVIQRCHVERSRDFAGRLCQTPRRFTEWSRGDCERRRRQLVRAR